jgi:ribosomal protein S18 acetylase RimI-like enzyme
VAGGASDGGSADGGPIGFVVLRTGPDHLLIDNVAVGPDHQGRGVGGRLLDHAYRGIHLAKRLPH